MKILNYLFVLSFGVILSFIFSQSFSEYTNIIFYTLIPLMCLISLRLVKEFKIRSIQLFFIGVFTTIIFIPLIGKKETSSFEKRALAPAPIFKTDNIWGYFSETQNYFSDRFAYRNFSVMFNSKFKFHLFRTSPMRNIVTIGKDNWLFYNPASIVKNTSELFTNNELAQVKQNLEIITKWFDLKGIKYYFMVVPIKPRIYPEMMDEILTLQFKNSKLDQLYKYLKNNSNIRIIDVRSELYNGKKIRPTYIKTDTHWNQFGAFLAYEKIMSCFKRDFPSIEIASIDNYKIDSAKVFGGDLQVMMGFEDEISYTQYEFVNKLGVKPIVLDSSKIENPSSINSIRKMPHRVNGLSLLVVRDSYAEYLRNFLTESFDQTFYAWTTNVPISRVMEQRPNIVFHEMLENFIMFNLNLPPEIEVDTSFIKKNYPNYKKFETELNP